MAGETNTGATSQSSSGNQGQQQSTEQGASGGASSQAQTTQAQTTQKTETQQTAALVRPDFIDEKFWDAKEGPKLKELAEDRNQLATQVAADQIRKNALPQKPEDVKIELPKEFKLPQGVEYKIDPTKPEFAKLQELAVRRGLDQDTVADLIGVYAETQVRDQTGYQAAKTAEIAKLGANGPVRVGAIETFLHGFVGEADAKALGSMMVSAHIVTAFEKMVAKFSSQGAAPFSQSHRVPQPQGRVSEDEFAKMSPAARLDYTRQFDQSQFQKAS